MLQVLRGGLYPISYRNENIGVLWIDAEGHRFEEQNSEYRPSVTATW